jgi:hypothetical protein
MTTQPYTENGTGMGTESLPRSGSHQLARLIESVSSINAYLKIGQNAHQQMLQCNIKAVIHHNSEFLSF